MPHLASCKCFPAMMGKLDYWSLNAIRTIVDTYQVQSDINLHEILARTALSLSLLRSNSIHGKGRMYRHSNISRSLIPTYLVEAL